MLVTLPSLYPRALAHPFTLKVLRARERTLTPHSSIVFTLDSHLNLLRSLGVRHIPCCGSDFPWILIFETPTFSNEIVSFEIMIMPIENNFGYVSKIKSSSSSIRPSNKS